MQAGVYDVSHAARLIPAAAHNPPSLCKPLCGPKLPWPRLEAGLCMCSTSSACALVSWCSTFACFSRQATSATGQDVPTLDHAVMMSAGPALCQGQRCAAAQMQAGEPRAPTGVQATDRKSRQIGTSSSWTAKAGGLQSCCWPACTERPCKALSAG